ncbi:histone-lysine N-methyltransferase SETMAR [Trichonephila clavata]|uniref:Histone-lysine N-methyltransferase SETMAR n=1 Tax=Trichonephila clavata TaxID=2740835 RepID=A0A8X6K837_TRICU|nr:histone-lysine N-methyltransferase SETMAR [Trichonephila clavata]
MTGWTLYTLEWDLMEHPPYMVPSDYYLFSRLHHDGIIFHSNDEVINEVGYFLDSRMPQYLAGGIEKLPKRKQTNVNLNGDFYPH